MEKENQRSQGRTKGRGEGGGGGGLAREPLQSMVNGGAILLTILCAY